MKLTIVARGSTYTPEIVDGLVRMRDGLDVTELALHGELAPAVLDCAAAAGISG